MPIGVDRETIRAAVKHESGSVRRGVSRSGVIDPDPLRSRVREALWRLPDPCLIRRHQSASALPWRSPPCQRDSLPDRDRRMRWHQATIDYVRRRTAEGLSKKDIIRCLKRFVAREIYHALIDDHRVGAACAEAA